MACIRPGIASAGGSLPLEDSMEKVSAMWNACFVVAVVHVSACFYGRSPRATGKAAVLGRN